MDLKFYVDGKIAEELFKELYVKYKYLSAYICYDVLKDYDEVEDAVNEVFFRLAKNLKNLKCNDEEQIKNYIKILSKHVAINMYNKLKNYPVLYEYETEIEDPYVFEDYIMDKHICNEIIRKLPPKYYEVMFMFVVEELSGEQIAEILDIKTDTVYKRLERARKILKQILERNT